MVPPRTVLRTSGYPNAVKDRPVSDVMTTRPVYVYGTDPAAAVLSVMAVSGHRYVPILNLDDQLVGIASPQRVTTFLRRYLADA